LWIELTCLGAQRTGNLRWYFVRNIVFNFLVGTKGKFPAESLILPCCSKCEVPLPNSYKHCSASNQYSYLPLPIFGLQPWSDRRWCRVLPNLPCAERRRRSRSARRQQYLLSYCSTKTSQYSHNMCYSKKHYNLKVSFQN
jgi:hypothetical protein